MKRDWWLIGVAVFISVGTIILCVLDLTSCAYHPQSFDSTRMAQVQDSVISGLLPVSRLHEFDVYARAQEAICPSNLTARQHELQGDTGKAEAGARWLIEQGQGYWPEGESYLRYVKEAWK